MSFFDELIKQAEDWRDRFGTQPTVVYLGFEEFDKYQRTRPRSPAIGSLVREHVRTPTMPIVDLIEITLEVVKVQKPSFIGFGA